MFIPEILYQQPLLKDRVTQQIEIVNQHIQVFGSSFNNAGALIYTVPLDRCFYFSTLAGQGVAEPLSGARARALSCFLQPDIAGVGLPLAAFPSNGIAVPSATQHFGGPTGVWLPPGARLSAQMTWDIDDQGHVSTMAIHGITIPRGNMARA